MTAADPTPAVNRAYQQGQVFGWVRETYVNAVQAGATQVLFTTEWTAATEIGVHRRVIFDDGSGMSADELPTFFNSWGGSAQSVGGLNENYGYGSKVSLLPWNTYGVVVLSRRDGATSMIWLHRGADGTYGIRPLEDVDDEGVSRFVKVLALSEYTDGYTDPDDPRVDWVDVMHSIFGEIGSGTAVVLLGNDPSENTAFHGDRSRREDTKLGIAQYLNSRFYTLPVPARVDPLYPTDPDEWPKKNGSNETRQARGLGDTITRGANDGIESGIVEIPAVEGAGLAARVHWWLAGAEVPTSGDRIVIPLFGYRFSSHEGIDEIYSLEAGHSSPHLGQLVVSAPVRRRVGILVEPVIGDELYVYPAGNSRAGLQYDVAGQGGGHDLPFIQWRAAWLRRVPDAIREAILAAMPKDDANPAVEAAIQKYLAEEFLPYLQKSHDSLVRDPAGEPHTGSDTADRSKAPSGDAPGRQRPRRGEHSRTPRPPVPQGEEAAPSVIARRQAGLVEVRLVDEPDRQHAVWFDGTAGIQCAYINKSSATYLRARNYLATKYRSLGRIGEEGDARWFTFVKLVEQVMRTQVTTAVTELLATANADKSKFDSYMSPEACSATLMGMNWISQAMSRTVTAANLPILGDGSEEDFSGDDEDLPLESDVI